MYKLVQCCIILSALFVINARAQSEKKYFFNITAPGNVTHVVAKNSQCMISPLHGAVHALMKAHATTIPLDASFSNQGYCHQSCEHFADFSAQDDSDTEIFTFRWEIRKLQPAKWGGRHEVCVKQTDSLGNVTCESHCGFDIELPSLTCSSVLGNL